MKAYGNADLIGNAVAKSAEIFGQSNFGGNLDAERVKIFGQADINGDVSLQHLKLGGSINIRGKLTGGDIRVSGEVSVGNDCEADSFYVKGVVTIGGTLNAEKIDIQLHFADSRIREIGGENIRVSKGRALSLLKLFKFFAADSAELSAESIEGDEIYLEHTKAKVVRGNNVTIGPGCVIDLVEYKTGFQQTGKSKVIENSKI
jgi:cytoskeletal protein CcmA (bactofilin family)